MQSAQNPPGQWAWLPIVAMLFGGCRSGADVATKGRSDTDSATKQRTIRVKIADGAATLDVGVGGPYRIYDQDIGQLGAFQASLPPTKLEPVKGGWRLRGRVWSARELWIAPRNDGTLRVQGRRYRGMLHCRRFPDGVLAVNVLDIESYLCGVVPVELLSSFRPATYRAQAIAARTYAFYEKFTVGRTRGFDVTSGESSQVYQGMDAETQKGRNAVEATYGQVLAWDAGNGPKMFSAYYSSACGGWTASAHDVFGDKAIAPLAGGTQCPHCRIAESFFPWKPLTLSDWQIRTGLARADPQFEGLKPIRTLRAHRLGPGQRILEVEIVDKGGRREIVNANDFRLAMGGHKLKSTLCRITPIRKGWLVHGGQGFGHGVGLCQWGAEGMARRGAADRQILRFYYPGSEVVVAY